MNWRSPPGPLRRWIRRLRRFGRRRPPLVYSRRYALEIPGVPLDPLRGEKILSFLDDRGLLRARQIVRARRIAMRGLRRVHEDDYLESLQNRGAMAALLGFDLPDELHDRFLDLQRTLVGGTCRAARLALGREGIAVNLGGGLHHATAGAGQGFCAFNDVAVAVAELRSDGFDEPVLVLDLDLHDGDGTRSIFAGDPTVHTFSIHNRDLGQVEAVASTSIALGHAVSDRLYLSTLTEHLPPLIESFRPGLIFYLAGTDPAEGDPLGDWSISSDALLERDRIVIDRSEAGSGRRPVVILLAGGYGEQAWRHSARFLGSVLGGGPETGPPPAATLAPARFRRIARLLRSTELTADYPESEWELTEDDVVPGHGRRRLLDYYSRHGVELALERYGLLDRLRTLGFDDVRLDFDPAGQSVRLLTGDEARQPLVELRVRRDRDILQTMELLSIEWLLLQDPTREFGPDRARLPGQSHPGLGLVREITAVLVLACERLELDGVVFVPAHYHIAVQAARFFVFLDPDREACFRALRAVLRRLPLADAARAIEQGRVIDRDTRQPFRWEPAAMAVAVSNGLERRLRGDDYRRAVGAPTRACRFELRDPGA